MKIIIIYHADCADGFAGAYAAWKKFGNEALFFPLIHNTPPPEIKNAEVYIIDFSFKEEVMKEIIKKAKKVIALDHHISAEKTTKMAHDFIYENDHSGCIIAWNYFHPTKKVPQLLLNIEDIELWKFKLRHTKELMTYLESIDFDFEIWDKIIHDCETEKIQYYLEQGNNLLRFKKRLIEKLVKEAKLVKFENYSALEVNSPLFHSEIGND